MLLRQFISYIGPSELDDGALDHASNGDEDRYLPFWNNGRLQR